MTKYEISREILKLLDYDLDELVEKVYELSDKVKRDGEVDDFCNRDWSGLQGGL